VNEERTAEMWLRLVSEKVGKLERPDTELVMGLALNILARWKAEAHLRSEAEGGSPEDVFKILYADRKAKAQGVIVAIVEVVRSVGIGGNPEAMLREKLN
jgi:hypothetical protein